MHLSNLTAEAHSLSAIQHLPKIPIIAKAIAKNRHLGLADSSDISAPEAAALRIADFVELLRGKLGLLEEDYAALQASLAQESAALDAERAFILLDLRVALDATFFLCARALSALSDAARWRHACTRRMRRRTRRHSRFAPRSEASPVSCTALHLRLAARSRA